MRGEDQRSGSLFSYVDLEARVGQSHPLRAIRALVNEALTALASVLFGAVFADWAAVNPTGETVTGDAAAGVLFDSFGAAVDGATGVRPVVPLVRRPRNR